MFILIVPVVAALIPVIPAVYSFLQVRHESPAEAAQTLFKGVVGFNVVLALMALGIGAMSFLFPSVALAAGPTAQEGATVADPYASLAAAISTGLAAVGAGIAVGNTGSAAVGTIAEKPESFGRALIFVGLAEGIAIYGLIISFMVLNR